MLNVGKWILIVFKNFGWLERVVWIVGLIKMLGIWRKEIGVVGKMVIGYCVYLFFWNGI